MHHLPRRALVVIFRLFPYINNPRQLCTCVDSLLQRRASTPKNWQPRMQGGASGKILKRRPRDSGSESDEKNGGRGADAAGPSSATGSGHVVVKRKAKKKARVNHEKNRYAQGVEETSAESENSDDEENAHAENDKKTSRVVPENGGTDVPPDTKNSNAKVRKNNANGKELTDNYGSGVEELRKYLLKRLTGLKTSTDPFNAATYVPEVDGNGSISLCQKEYFTLQSGSDMRPVDFTVWLAMRMNVERKSPKDAAMRMKVERKSPKDASAASAAGAAGGDDDVNDERVLKERGNAYFLRSILSLLALRLQEVERQCLDIHGHGKVAWNQMCNMALHMRDFTQFCVRDFSAANNMTWGRYLQSLQCAQAIRRNTMTIMHLARDQPHYSAHIIKGCVIPEMVKISSELMQEYKKMFKVSVEGAFLQSYSDGDGITGSAFKCLILTGLNMIFSDGDPGSEYFENGYEEIEKAEFMQLRKMSRDNFRLDQVVCCMSQDHQKLLDTAREESSNHMESLKQMVSESITEMGRVPEFPGVLHESLNVVGRWRKFLNTLKDRFDGALAGDSGGRAFAEAVGTVLKKRVNFLQTLDGLVQDNMLHDLHGKLKDAAKNALEAAEPGHGPNQAGPKVRDLPGQARKVVGLANQILECFDPAESSRARVQSIVVRNFTRGTFSACGLMTCALLDFNRISDAESSVPLLFDVFAGGWLNTRQPDNGRVDIDSEDEDDVYEDEDETHGEGKHSTARDREKHMKPLSDRLYILGCTGKKHKRTQDVDRVLMNILPVVQSMKTEMEWTRGLHKKILTIRKVRTDSNATVAGKTQAEKEAAALTIRLKDEITEKGILLSESFTRCEDMKTGMKKARPNSVQDIVENHVGSGWQTINGAVSCRTQLEMHTLMHGTDKDVSFRSCDRLQTIVRNHLDIYDEFTGITKKKLVSNFRDELQPWNLLHTNYKKIVNLKRQFEEVNEATQFIEQVLTSGSSTIPLFTANKKPNDLNFADLHFRTQDKLASHALHCLKSRRVDDSRTKVLRLLRSTSKACVDYLEHVSGSDCYRDNLSPDCALLLFLTRVHDECEEYVGTGVSDWAGGMGVHDEIHRSRLLWLCENAMSNGMFVSDMLKNRGENKSSIFSRPVPTFREVAAREGDYLGKQKKQEQGPSQPIVNGDAKLSLNVSRDVSVMVDKGDNNDVKSCLRNIISEICENCDPRLLVQVCNSYDRLGRLEMYHATISQMTSDTMCTLSGLCSGMDFLMDEFMCDRIPSHLLSSWRINRSSTHHEVVDVPLFNLEYKNHIFSQTHSNFFLDSSGADIAFNAKIDYKCRTGNSALDTKTSNYNSSLKGHTQYVCKLRTALKAVINRDKESAEENDIFVASWVRSMCQAYGDWTLPKQTENMPKPLHVRIQESLLGSTRMASHLNSNPESAFMSWVCKNTLKKVGVAMRTYQYHPKQLDINVYKIVWKPVILASTVLMQDCLIWEWEENVKRAFPSEKWCARIVNAKGQFGNFIQQMIHVVMDWAQEKYTAMIVWKGLQIAVTKAVHCVIFNDSRDDIRSQGKRSEQENVSAFFNEFQELCSKHGNIGTVLDLIENKTSKALKSIMIEFHGGLHECYSRVSEFGIELRHEAMENWKNLQKHDNFSECQTTAESILEANPTAQLTQKIRETLSGILHESDLKHIVDLCTQAKDHEMQKMAFVLSLMVEKKFTKESDEIVQAVIGRRMLAFSQVCCKSSLERVVQRHRFADVFSRHKIRRNRILSETSVDFWEKPHLRSDTVFIRLTTGATNNTLDNWINDTLWGSSNKFLKMNFLKGVTMFDRFVSNRFKTLFSSVDEDNLIFKTYKDLNSGMAGRLEIDNVERDDIDALRFACGNVSDFFDYDERTIQIEMKLHNSLEEMVQNYKDTSSNEETERSQRKTARDEAIKLLQGTSKDNHTTNANRQLPGFEEKQVEEIEYYIISKMHDCKLSPDFKKNATKISQYICESVHRKEFRRMVVDLAVKGLCDWDKCIDLVRCAAESGMPAIMAVTYLGRICSVIKEGQVKVNLQQRVGFSRWALRERARLMLVFVFLKKVVPDEINIHEYFVRQLENDIPTLLGCMKQIAPEGLAASGVDLTSEDDIVRVIKDDGLRNMFPWKSLLFLRDELGGEDHAMEVDLHDDRTDPERMSVDSGSAGGMLVRDVEFDEDDNDADDGRYHDPNALESVLVENFLANLHDNITNTWDDFSVQTFESLHDAMQVQQLAALKRDLYKKSNLKTFISSLVVNGGDADESLKTDAEVVWGKNLFVVDSSISEAVRAECAENMLRTDMDYALKYLIDEEFYRTVLLNCANDQSGISDAMLDGFKVWGDEDMKNLKEYRNGIWMGPLKRSMRDFKFLKADLAPRMMQEYSSWSVASTGGINKKNVFQTFFRNVLTDVMKECSETLSANRETGKGNLGTQAGSGGAADWRTSNFVGPASKMYFEQSEVVKGLVKLVVAVAERAKEYVHDAQAFRALQYSTDSDEYKQAYTSVMRNYSIAAFAGKLRGILPAMWKVALFKESITQAVQGPLQSHRDLRYREDDKTIRKIQRLRNKKDSDSESDYDSDPGSEADEAGPSTSAVRVAAHELSTAGTYDDGKFEDILESTKSCFEVLDDTVAVLKSCVGDRDDSDFIDAMGNAFKVLSGNGTDIEDVGLGDEDILGLTVHGALDFAKRQMLGFEKERSSFKKAMQKRNVKKAMQNRNVQTSAYSEYENAFDKARDLLTRMDTLVQGLSGSSESFRRSYHSFATEADASIRARQNATVVLSDDNDDSVITIRGVQVAKQDDINLCKLRFLLQNQEFKVHAEKKMKKASIDDMDSIGNVMKEVCDHLEFVNMYFKEVEIYEDLMHDLREFRDEKGRFENLAITRRTAMTDRTAPKACVQAYLKEMEERKRKHEAILSDKYDDDQAAFEYEPSYDEQKVFIAKSVVLRNENLAGDLMRHDFNPYKRVYDMYDSDAKVNIMDVIMKNIQQLVDAMADFRGGRLEGVGAQMTTASQQRRP